MSGFPLSCLKDLHTIAHLMSAYDATLATGGWLTLTRRGLAPRKTHQASLGARRGRKAGRPAPPAQIPA